MRPEPILFHNVLWKCVSPVASTFRPAFCIYSWHCLSFNLREAVRHMSSSFSFKHIATKFKKMVDMASCFFDLQTKTPVSIILYACLLSNSKICVDEIKKSIKHILIVNFHKFVVVSYSHAASVAVRSNHFWLVDWLVDAKVMLNGHAVTQNYVFVVYQSEATKNNSHD